MQLHAKVLVDIAMCIGMLRLTNADSQFRVM